MPLEIEWLLSPWALGVLGLCVGSFLNVVIHRLPLMMERQWLGEAAAQLDDAAGISRVAGAPQAEADELAAMVAPLTARLEKLPPLGISLPRSRCPSCGHQLAWHENL